MQAAINAATSDLPSDLPTRPYYRKFNPADAPIMTLALTSATLSPGQVYDAADTILAQRLSQLDGVSQVQINGAEKPAVRVRLNPGALRAANLAGQDVFTAIRAANVTEATGSFEGRARAEDIAVNGQMTQASEYAGLVIKSQGGSSLRISDVASVIDGVANSRLAAWDGKTPAILLTISKVRRCERDRDGGPDQGGAAASAGLDAAGHQGVDQLGPDCHDPRQRGRCGDFAADLRRPGVDGGVHLHAPPGADPGRRGDGAAVDLRGRWRRCGRSATAWTISR